MDYLTKHITKEIPAAFGSLEINLYASDVFVSGFGSDRGLHTVHTRARGFERIRFQTTKSRSLCINMKFLQVFQRGFWF